MNTDKDIDALDQVDGTEADETNEEDLEWLLDMEETEQEDTLFKVEGDDNDSGELTEFEAQMAARPMSSGGGSADDLANFVDEEIVISSESAANDIYSVDEGPDDTIEDQSQSDKYMTVEFTRDEATDSGSSAFDEGSDVLGLASEDDMGETFLTIKRVKNEKPQKARSTVARAKPQSDIDQEGEEQPMVSVTSSSQSVQQAVGGDVAGGSASSDEDAFDLDSLDEAPVTSQVADPSTQTVANEAGSDDLPADESIEDFSLEEIETGDSFGIENTEADSSAQENLDDILALKDEEELQDFADIDAEAPHRLDDDAFDELLLSGELDTSADIDVDDLAVEDSEDVLSLDTSEEDRIDLHEDFDHFGDVDRDVFDQVAAVMPQLLEQANAMVHERLASLSMSTEDAALDAILATDNGSIQAAAAEGFAPVSEVLAVLPECIVNLQPADQALIYVRIVSGGENLNKLFEDSFADSSTDNVADKPAENFADTGKTDPSATENREVEAEEASPFLGGLGGDLADTDDDFLGDIDTFEAAGNDDFDEEFGFEFAEESDAETDQDDLEAAHEDVFGADFSAELDDELPSLEGEAADDIDDAFATLESASSSDGEGLEALTLGEFGVDEDLPELEDATGESAGEAPEPAAEASGPGRSAESTDMPGEDQREVANAAPGVTVVAGSDASDLSWCIPQDIAFSLSSESGAEIFSDFLDAFIEEGSAEVERLEDLISEWEKAPGDEEIFAEVGRRLHTVKGIAKGVGLQRFGTLIHNYETLLDALERPAGESDAQTYFRIVNVWLDAVVRGIDFVTEERQDIASELPQLGQATEPLELEGGQAKNAVDKAARRDDKPDDQQLADEGAKVLASQQSVRITSEKLDHLLNLSNQTQQLCVRASQTTNRNKRSTAELQGRLQSVRTHIGKIADRALLSVNARGDSTRDLDALEMDQYSELQEAASILREGVEDLADLVEVLMRQNTQSELLLKQQSSVISSISSSIQGARVVPVSRLMPGLRRIVRTASTDLGKLVNFRVLNEVGALDRDHYSRLQVALEHMVRNALDHGIESPEVRAAAGKPDTGAITIDVRKSGGDYIIRLTDDGKGIDPDALRESAFQKGLDIDVDALSDDEAVRLIFHKGFSTASKVSEISGRGVGMDIVLTELQQIGGDVNIQSKVGEGTTFEVKIPSSVTVNGALMVTSGDRSYAIPLNGLIAVEQVPADDYFAAVRNQENLELFDMSCEPAYLATLCDGVALPERSFWEAFVPVIIAGTDSRRMAIAIDSLEEALELVVRSLGTQFSRVPGLAGAATTADGEAIIALDLNLLVEGVDEEGTASIADGQEQQSNKLFALVVDDSRTQRIVATSQLDTVGVESVTAENGQVAIDLLNATHRLPDIVLLDVEMPVKDGIETLREIRKSQRYGHLPVIMVTSRTGAKHRALAKEAGCNAYMGKPFNFPALVEQINVLTRHNLQLS